MQYRNHPRLMITRMWFMILRKNIDSTDETASHYEKLIKKSTD